MGTGPVDAAPARPADPDASTPQLAAPGGQPQDDRRRKFDHWAGNESRRRRVALSLGPIFASYRMSFLGREMRPLRGAGLGADVDAHLAGPVGVRATASYSAHPVRAEYDQPEDGPPTLRANAGVIHTVDFGGGVVFAMDTGRARPMLEAGLGATILRTPAFAQDGQLGGACVSGTGCDIGLFCAVEQNVCKQGIIPRAHAGAAVEIMLGDRWSIAATIRYFALLSAPTVFPVYLQAGLKVLARF
jgi:hypothetical protein